MEIEEVAAKHPEKILSVPSIRRRLQAYHAREIAFGLGLDGQQVGTAVEFVLPALYKAFIDLDCAIVEINPLVVTKAGDLSGARRQDRTSTTTPCFVTRTSRPARRDRGRPDGARGGAATA